MNVPAMLREGRPMHEALTAGESNALLTILDANASAVIVGAVRT